MLLALCLGFTLSQSYRTLAAILALPLQQAFGLDAGELGLLAGTFHFTFGAMQVVMGVGLDLHGVRRTVLLSFPLAVLGAGLSVVAQGYGQLVLGQALIGVGCAPAFLACTVFIAQRFPAAAFAATSGLVMGLSGVGLLLTGTPLAWVVDTWSWRAVFGVLALASVLAWLGMYLLVHEPATTRTTPRDSWSVAMRGFAALWALPHTWGILALSAVTYASFIALRGLWLGPLLSDRHGLGLVATGHVALAVSLVGLLGPPLFGRLRLQGWRRRRWIAGFTLAMAAMHAVIAGSPAVAVTIATSLLIGFWCGYIVLQYADVRASYPDHLIGRAMSVFTMAMFLGIAFVQGLTGWVAQWAQRLGWDPHMAVSLAIAGLLVLGTGLFMGLPAAPAVARPPRRD
jgi:MFS family permease